MDRETEAIVSRQRLPRIGPALQLLANLLSDKSLTKKAYLNALASALDYAAQLLVGFVVTPLLVAGLGQYYFGIWQILNRLIGYISPASGRPTQALKWMIANQQAATDDDRKRRYVGSSLAVWLLFLPVLAVLGGVVTWFAPFWLRAPEESFTIIRLASAFLVANLALISLSDTPRAVLEGENLGYKRIGLTVSIEFIGGGLTWLALYLNLGVAGVAVAAVLATCVSGLLFLHVVGTYVPWFGIARPSFAGIRRYLGLSWWFLGWNLVMQAMMGSDVLLLGRFNSVESVTSYTLSKYAPETLISIIAMMLFASAPGLGGIIGSGDLRKAARIRSEMMALTWLLVTVLGTTVLLWNRAFVTLWVGADQYMGSVPSLLVVVMVTQFVLLRNDANLIDLTLRLNRKVIMGLISVAVSLGAAAVLIGYFKLAVVGLCIGIIAGRLIMSVGYPLLVGRFLGLRFLAQLKGALRPAAATVLLYSTATWLDSLRSSNDWAAPGWVAFALLVVLTAGLVGLVAFFGGLSQQQRTKILGRVKSVITRGQA